jgi:hypothetical protein
MDITLNDADADQVAAILKTHAEMQDQRVNSSMELLARMKKDEPGSVMIDDLQEQVNDFDEDSTNLTRLANLFDRTVHAPR